MTRWAILTGEYPPQPGGVSDYTRLVATGLEAAGDCVTVFAPPCDGERSPVRGPMLFAPASGPSRGSARCGDDLTVRRLPDHFGPRGLLALDAAVRARRFDRILVQYVPHAYGYKAMNVPFAAWVAGRARRAAPVWVMFHEVAFPFGRRPSHLLLGAVTRVTARLLAAAAARVFVSIPAWGDAVHGLCPRARPEWLPVPCNVATEAAATAVADVRRRLGGGAPTVVGHFGTFGGLITDLLEPAAVAVLRAHGAARLLLFGRNSDRFRAAVAGRHPDVAGRVAAAGELPAAAVAAHLRACDLLLQPYPDGISSRRGSVMAGLANGVPVASNLGPLSEPLWGAAGVVGLAPRPEPGPVAAAAAAVVALTPAARADMARRAADLYQARFAPANTIRRLRNEDLCPAAC